jgi:bis(5'-nucleosyl)-tetraphosphatase (symmetrical)
MATFAIGDIQGCHQELLDLLEAIRFDPSRDRLWFTGDLVNRGPDSLNTLRTVRDTGGIVVLGNHDLHLLAIAYGKALPRKKDTLDAILAAPDREELLEWLRTRPLLHIDHELGYTLVHAGLPPQWDAATAESCAREVEHVLRGSKAGKFFARMYGDLPDLWAEGLEKWDRYRYIVNALTRLRYCDQDGRVALRYKGPPGSQPADCKPWYHLNGRKNRGTHIIFGHWATVTLGPEKDFAPFAVHPLDTGCVWGGPLTAMRLEDRRYFSVPSRQQPFDGRYHEAD